jgi:hypothetical protein
MMSIAQGVQHTFYRGKWPMLQDASPQSKSPLKINDF